MSRSPLRVGMLGAGTVGRAVIDSLIDHPDRLVTADGAALRLAAIAIRDLEKARKASLPTALLTDAPAHVVADPATDVIVEVIGGDEPARTLIAAALGAGKAVVTANKHVLAHHGPDLEATSRRTGAALRFEAAVGGGIPVLGTLAGDLAANDITRVRGIINGTTNYILTAMAHEGRSYRDVLEDAQALGYAEVDPSGDVEGDDAVNKLVILARLAFGQWLDPRSVGRRPPTARGMGRPGVTGVTDQELEGAAALGLTIKLLATATHRTATATHRTGDAAHRTATATHRTGDATHRAGDDAAADGAAIEAAVVPTAVPTDSPFGWTDGVLNRIEIDAEPLGTVGLSGPGAGGLPTSSAVLGDLLAIARGGGSTWAGLTPATAPAIPAADPLDGPRHWYAFVPAVRAGVTLPTALDEAAAVTFEDGTAIRSEVVTLAEAKAAFDAILPAGADVTLYPVDD